MIMWIITQEQGEFIDYEKRVVGYYTEKNLLDEAVAKLSEDKWKKITIQEVPLNTFIDSRWRSAR